MKRLTVCLALVAACSGGSDADHDAPSTADAPSVDAASVDAASVDATVDAMPDAMVDPVTITVFTQLGDGAPDPNAIVISYDAAGAAIHDVVTDSAGIASIYVPDGGGVTVLQISIEGITRYVNLTTIRPVHPGDQLVAGAEQRIPFKAGAMDSMTMSYTLPAGTTYSAVIDPCESAGPDGTPGEVSIGFWDTCGQPTFSVGAIADDSAGNRKFAYQPGNTHVPGGAFALTAPWTAMTPATVTFDNVPDNLQRVFARWKVMLDGYPWMIDQKAAELPPPGTSVVNPIHPAGAGNGTFVYAAGVRGIELTEDFAVESDTPLDATTIDFTGMPLPRPASQPTQTPSGVSWTQTDVGAPDERIVTWSATWTNGSSEHHVDWKLVEDPGLPPGSALPRLPAAFDQDDPQTVDPVVLQYRGAYVTHVDYDNLAGWDAARPYGPWLEWLDRRFLGVAHQAHATRLP